MATHPPPSTTKSASTCVQDAVLEVNRELVAQNIWLREQLTANLIKDKNKPEDAVEELRLENERLRQQVLELEKKLEKKKGIVLLSAKVVESRIAYRDNQQFVEYKLQVETDSQGTLFVWHLYSTFMKLAANLQTKEGRRKTIPELPNEQIFANFTEKSIQERVVTLNQFLEAAINSNHLQWGIRVDTDTCVFKRRKKTTATPSSYLKTKDWTLHSRKSDVQTYASVSCVKVVDSRIQKLEENPFIEYHLRLKTDVHNTILVWHRYSTLYDWAEAMQRENICHMIPQLPKEEPFSSSSEHVQHQAATIKMFFKKVLKLEPLQFVARVDGDTFVCELRVKDAASTSQRAQGFEFCNPLASVSKLLPLKSIVQRQRKRSEALRYEHKMAQTS